jgi:hypothetical protein
MYLGLGTAFEAGVESFKRLYLLLTVMVRR